MERLLGEEAGQLIEGDEVRTSAWNRTSMSSRRTNFSAPLEMIPLDGGRHSA